MRPACLAAAAWLWAAAGYAQSPAPAAASPPPPASPSPGPRAALSPAQAAAIRGALERAMTRHGIPGLSAAVAARGEIVFSDALGMADLERFTPARPETIYRLASVSKPITATAVLQLFEQGRLDLDAPIQSLVPGWPEKAWRPTVRHVLAHQSGVRNWTRDEFHDTRRYVTVADSIAFFRDDPLAFEPGTKTLYTSLGYSLLGVAIETVAGMRYDEYLRARVFAPAGMAWARVDEVLPIVPNRASGYQKGAGEELMNAALSDVTNRVPGGGLAATAEDVARFGRALLAGELLKPETVRLAFTSQRLRDGRTTGYGLGWVVARDGREVYHQGGQPRVSTILYLVPRQGLAVAILCNLEGVGEALRATAREIAAAVDPAALQR